MRRYIGLVVAAMSAALLVVLTAIPAWAAEQMTLTFVRHGESEANAAGIIDTSVPGPHLTPTGEQQAAAVAIVLADRDAVTPYDGIYTSSMVRTQETADPLVQKLGESYTVLPGLREISAGFLEGSSETDGLGRIGYGLAPMAWVFGLRSVALPGAEDGNAFEQRVNGAIDTMYGNGDRNALAFAHGATIMFWTMMNVDNPDPFLILTHPLGNTAIVVVTGNNDDGWTLRSWDGAEVAEEPSLPTKLFVDVRNLIVAPQKGLFDVQQAIATGDLPTIATAIRDAAVDVGTAVVNFPVEVARDVFDAGVDAIVPGQPKQSTVAPEPAVTTTPAAEVKDAEPASELEIETAPAIGTETETEKVDSTPGLKNGNKATPAKAGQTALRKVVQDAVTDFGKTLRGGTGKPDTDSAPDTGQERDAA
jgi:broad specificity phosphatase PhoE